MTGDSGLLLLFLAGFLFLLGRRGEELIAERFVLGIHGFVAPLVEDLDEAFVGFGFETAAAGGFDKP